MYSYLVFCVAALLSHRPTADKQDSNYNLMGFGEKTTYSTLYIIICAMSHCLF